VNTKKCRSFTILDAMILIAAIAIGFAWARYFETSGGTYQSEYPDADERDYSSKIRANVEKLNWWRLSLSHFVAVFTVAMLVLRLWGEPWKRLRYLIRLPGTVVGGAVSMTVLMDVGNSILEILTSIYTYEHRDEFTQYAYLIFSGQNAGVATAVALGLLAISGRWRRESGWLDGMGLALGVFWIFQGLLAEVAWIVHLFVK
jgi:hypothetical protein